MCLGVSYLCRASLTVCLRVFSSAAKLSHGDPGERPCDQGAGGESGFSGGRGEPGRESVQRHILELDKYIYMNILNIKKYDLTYPVESPPGSWLILLVKSVKHIGATGLT